MGKSSSEQSLISRCRFTCDFIGLWHGLEQLDEEGDGSTRHVHVDCVDTSPRGIMSGLEDSKTLLVFLTGVGILVVVSRVELVLGLLLLFSVPVF